MPANDKSIPIDTQSQHEEKSSNKVALETVTDVSTPSAHVSDPSENALPGSVQPKPIRSLFVIEGMNLLVDLILCLLPLLFLVLAILAGRLDGTSLSGYGENIHQLTLVAPTIFPIIFAAVIGKSLRNIARYKLERGSNVKTIELLLGSQSVFGTFSTQITLRLCNILGISILVLWLVSPLGGQASLRLLSNRNETSTTNTQLAYMNITNSSSAYLTAGPGSFSSPSIDGLYISSLVAPLSVKRNPLDIWGNLKIPMLESLTSKPDKEGFITVPATTDVDFSSLIGLPMSGLPDFGASDLIIPTLYYDIQCSELYSLDGYSNWWESLNITDIDLTSVNYTDVWTVGSSFVSSFISSPSLRPDYIETENQLAAEMAITWASWSGELDSQTAPGNYFTSLVTVAKCTMRPSHVEARVICDGLVCRVDSIRRRTDIIRPTNGSDYEANQDYYGALMNSASVFAIWAQHFSGATSYQIPFVPSSTQVYLNGTEDFPYVADGVTDLYKLSPNDFATRLRRLMNTYWTASLGARALPGSIPKDNHTSYETVLSSLELLNDRAQLSLSTLPATHTITTEVYHVSTKWLVLTILASLILFVVGVIGLTAHALCRGPEILGYFTTALRYNPYIAPHLRDKNSFLDSKVVARSNAGMTVKLGDVWGEREVGLLAVSSGVGPGIADTHRRDGGRLYI